MASEDDYIAPSLPQPPPPAPARREAAIGEALRRFDGGDAPRVAPQTSGPWWGRANRPQLGVLVAAALLAVIGLPVAWLTVSENGRPATELASRETVDLRTFDVAEDPAPAAPAALGAPAAVSEPRLSAPRPAEVAVNLREERASKAAAPPALFAGEDVKRAGHAADARSPAVLAQAAPSIVTPTSPAAAPPPPPATIMREAPVAAKPKEGLAAADIAEDVIVTSARRRGRAVVADRGDWNACTINDPKRSLAACRHLINPGAKGTKGQAAAHLADGLSLAWQGNMDRAIAAFDRAIAIAPKSSLAYLNRGLAHQRQSDADRALADLDRAVRLAPSAARGYYSRSLLLRERGDVRRADADEVRAVTLDGDYEAVIN